MPPDVVVTRMQRPAWPHSTTPLLRPRWRAAMSWELRPSLASSLLRVVGRRPLRPQHRFRRRHPREDVAMRAAHGATSPPRSWRRTSLELHPARSSSLAGGSRFSALPLLSLTDGRMSIRLGSITRCTRDYTHGPPFATYIFFRSEIGLYRPTFHRHIVVHTPWMRLSLHLPRLQCRRSWSTITASVASSCWLSV